jgi:hypothetical protein
MIALNWMRRCRGYSHGCGDCGVWHCKTGVDRARIAVEGGFASCAKAPMPSDQNHSGGAGGRRRKAKFEREQKLVEARFQELKRFSARLIVAHTIEDARSIVADKPALETPGRGFYSNLSMFLRAFKPPRGASCDELSMYVALLERIAVSSTATEPVVIANAIKALQIRMIEKGCG